MKCGKNIGKIIKGLFLVCAISLIMIHPYKTYNVAAAEKYYGYQKKTKTVKTKTKASKKTTHTKKNYRREFITKNVNTKWSDAYQYTYGEVKKIHVKAVTTIQKTYHGHSIKTKRNVKTTTTENKINFIRQQKKINFDGRIPNNVQKQLNKEKIKIVVDPKLNHLGTFSLKNKKISLKYNCDYILLHEIGHFVDCENDMASDSSEFYNIYQKERSKYRGFYNDYYRKTDFGRYERSSSAEYFAGTYRDYYFSKDSRSRLKTYCPNTYNFLSKICRV